MDSGQWAAPGRVNLIGEHTDYNDGFVLPFALPLRATVTASLADGPQWTASSTARPDPVTFGPDELRPGGVEGWAQYVAGVVWALRGAGFDPPGARLAIDSDIPVGAGLSSSHAMECAVLTALCDLGDLDLPLADRPRLVQRAENDYVGAPTGIMDQTASLMCRAGHALFLDCRSMALEHIPFDLAAAGMAILVLDTRAPHKHSDGEYGVRRRTCEEAARILGIPALRDVTDLDAALSRLPDEVSRKRVRHVVTENQRVLDTVALLRAGRFAETGPLLTASHASMRDDYEITVPEVDTAVSAALDAGAYGARMTGGGFGGCVLALIDASAADAVGGAVAKAFADAGFAPPAAFTAVPSGGATRVTG
ncbi:MAG: galactokinase [Actinobacteria bacterium 13_2_20CM_2_72_6]|nr:MAG: galactokinase [Actinobacteria bacterium 13_2_20CM_2_72_6]